MPNILIIRRILMKKRAFTLAETLITLTILGVVAAITIPALVNRQIENSNRTKVKKAMATYEKALNQIVIDNDIKTDAELTSWTQEQNDCDKTIKYFNPVEEVDPCIVKMPDGLWWDIGDIKNPIIFLNKKLLTPIPDWYTRLDYAKTLEDENGKKIYVYAMIGRIDSKTDSLRINDKAYEDSEQFEDYPIYLAKLYSFVNNTENLDLKYSKACQNECDVMSYLGGNGSGCNACSSDVSLLGFEGKILWDDNGNHYKITVERPLGNDGVEKTVINSDFSYTGYQTDADGKKTEDFKCGHIEVTNSGYNCTGSWDETNYYETGKPKIIVSCSNNCSYGWSGNEEGITDAHFNDGVTSGEIKAFYKNGKPSYEQKLNEDGTYCIKTYNTDGSIKDTDGDACED